MTVTRRENEIAGSAGFSGCDGDVDSGKEEEEMEGAEDLIEEVSVLELMLE